MDGRLAVTQRGGQLKAEDGSYHSTQDPERDLPPLFTTAPPFSNLDHQPPFKPFPPYDPRRQSHEQYFHDSGGASHHPTMPSSRSRHLRDPSTQLVPHEDAPPFSDLAASRPTTLAPSVAALTQSYMTNIQHGPSADTQRSSEEPQVAMTMGSLTPTDVHPSSKISSNIRPKNATIQVKNAKDKVQQIMVEHDATGSDIKATSPSVSGDLDDETTTSTIITTTVITTMQMPGTVYMIIVIYIIYRIYVTLPFPNIIQCIKICFCFIMFMR